jgi:hypothetical protein
MAGQICRMKPGSADGLPGLYISVFDCNLAGLENGLVERWRGLAEARRADGTHLRAEEVVLVHTNDDAVRISYAPEAYQVEALVAATQAILRGERGRFGELIAAIYSREPPHRIVAEFH